MRCCPRSTGAVHRCSGAIARHGRSRNVVQCRVVQCRVVQCRAVRCRVVRCRVCGVAPCGAVSCGTASSGAVACRCLRRLVAGMCGCGVDAPAGRAALRASCRDVRPAAQFLSLLRQRKEPKKGDPDAAPLAGARGPLRCSRRGAVAETRPCGAQTSAPDGAARRNPAPLRSSAPHTGKSNTNPVSARCASPRRIQKREDRGWCPERGDAQRAERSCIPRRRRRGAQRDGVAARSAVERRCLSPRRGRVSALAPAREHRSGPLATARGAEVGSPFFAYFLWRSKESRCAAGRTSRHEARSAARPAGAKHRPLPARPSPHEARSAARPAGAKRTVAIPIPARGAPYPTTRPTEPKSNAISSEHH